VSGKDKGMRTIKRHIESILLKLNTIKLIGCDMSGKLNVNFPLVITTNIVDKILYVDELKDESSYQHMYI